LISLDAWTLPSAELDIPEILHMVLHQIMWLGTLMEEHVFEV